MPHDQAQNAHLQDEGFVDYKAVVSLINEGVIILQDDKIVFVNPAFAHLIGKDIQEITGNPLARWIVPDHLYKVRQCIESLEKQCGEAQRIEFELDTLPRRIVEMKANIIRFSGKDAVLCALGDITQRRKKTLETQRRHTRLRSIIDSMRHVVISFSYGEGADETTQRDAAFYDRYLVEINPAAEGLYGVPWEDFLRHKRSIFDFVHPKDKEQVIHHYNSLCEDGIGEITYRVIGPNKEVRWVLDYGRVEYLEKGKVRRVNHIIEDITTEKHALDELKVNEDKYRKIFELSKDMICILKPDGTFLDINQAGLDLLGLEGRAEAFVRNMNEFHVDPSVRKALIREMAEKGETTRSRVLLKNTRDEIIEVDLHVIARKDEMGSVVSYQGIVHNVTESIRLKELEAVGMLAGCFADDLASPLSIIMMGINAIGNFLGDMRMDIDRLIEPAKEHNIEELIEGIRYFFEEIVYFNNESMLACKDITGRLEEIRSQYWKFRKISDGYGGLIYQRGSKAGG